MNSLMECGGLTSWDFCFIRLTIPNMCSEKKLKRAPITCCFRMGNSQVLASEAISTSKLSGTILKNFSGPIALTADPRHSLSCKLKRN